MPPSSSSRAALEGEGFVFRGRFTPGAPGEEWCERRLLARVHRYTLDRLRRDIQPVSQTDFLRVLLAWQRVDPDGRAEGPGSLDALLGQLEGFEAAASAWEGEILPARMKEYDPSWLDGLCLAGRWVWGRGAAPSSDGTRRSGPVRATPIALLSRGGLPIAVLEGREPRFLVDDLDAATRWQAQSALVRRSVAPRLKAYLGRSA